MLPCGHESKYKFPQRHNICAIYTFVTVCGFASIICLHCVVNWCPLAVRRYGDGNAGGRRKGSGASPAILQYPAACTGE